MEYDLTTFFPSNRNEKVRNSRRLRDHTPSGRRSGGCLGLPFIQRVGRLCSRQVGDNLLVLAGLKRVCAARRKRDHSSDRSPPLIRSFSSLIDAIQTVAAPA